MIHRDLAARNVLVTEENICKVHIAVLYVLQGTPSNINVLLGAPIVILHVLVILYLCCLFKLFEKNSSVLVCINMLCVYFGVRRQ